MCTARLSFAFCRLPRRSSGAREPAADFLADSLPPSASGPWQCCRSAVGLDRLPVLRTDPDHVSTVARDSVNLETLCSLSGLGLPRLVPRAARQLACGFSVPPWPSLPNLSLSRGLACVDQPLRPFLWARPVWFWCLVFVV